MPSPFIVAALGMLVLTILDSFIKSLAGTYATFQIVCLRFAFGALWASAIVAYSGHSLPPAARMKAHMARAALMIVTASGFFYALGKVPLAELFAISFTAPIFTAIFGAVFLKEKVLPSIMIAIAAGFAGMLVIVLGPTEGGGLRLAYEPFALFCAVISPITYALAIVLLRSQASSEPMSVIISVQSAMVALAVSPLAIATFEPPTVVDWAKFAIAGLLGTTGYFAFTHALKHLTAARFSVVEYTGLIWASLIGYFIFNEVPKSTVWAGAALIIAGCLLAVRAKSEGKALPEAS
ncbi:MAG TPA: DMT family transporter [Beijerinckiaceae bacterium]|nr:DMT family transporter [Beijerinckiaceae bacterium]